MMLEWFNGREAAELGTALADQFAQQMGSGSATRGEKRAAKEPGKVLQQLLRRADLEVRTLRLNIYKRAKFAHSFKWKLLDYGVQGEVADEVTQSLVLHLSLGQADLLPGRNSAAAPADRPWSIKARYLFAQANEHFDQGAYAEAVTLYEDLVRLLPYQADALNNLGSALCKLGRYKEAEDRFSQAIGIKPDCPEA